MTTYYRLDVSYGLSIARSTNLHSEDQKIIKIVGMRPDDSGAGFGMRDLGWVFELRTPATVIRDKLLAAGYNTARVSEHETE